MGTNNIQATDINSQITQVMRNHHSARNTGNQSARASSRIPEKVIDTTTRFNAQDSGENSLQWQVRDLAQPQSRKVNKKLGHGTAWPSEGELAGHHGVQEIEQKTSGITLEQDADVRMHDVDQSQPARSSYNGRKRTGEACMEGTGSPVQQIRESHAVQSPKRTRAQAPKRFEAGRGLGSPVSGRPRKNQPLDPEFDRSRYEFDHPGEDEGGGPVRAIQQRRLYDPQRDPPSAFRVEEDSSKRLEDPPPAVRSSRNSRPKGDQKKKESKLFNPRAQPPRSTNIPAQQQQQQQPGLQGSREGGKIMILNNMQTQTQLQSSHTEEDDDIPRMVPQPETRPISPEQLVIEVKGIYAGLMMVETKCSEVDKKQAAAALEPDKHPKLNNEQWQALIALHRTLLHEHHDFFLASQHPSASPSLRKLALRYAMPARMWKHGIHSFLELLRHRLPHSLEHMLTFIYLAYSMMALLYETVPAFEDTWIECLGDLGRYRMAIEDDDIRDRDTWANVARFWYSKAVDKTPYVGRLHHHLAILAKPNILQQLFYYCKSLGVTQPFSSSRESILTLFDPIFAPDNRPQKAQPVDTAFIQLHGINFTHIDLETFEGALDDFLGVLDKHISDPKSKWKVSGAYIAVCNITGLFQYGAKDSLLRQAWRQGRKVEETDDTSSPNTSGDANTAEFDLLPPIPNEASSEHVTSLLQPISKLEREYQNKSGDVMPSSEGFTAQEISLDYSKRLAYEILTIALERGGGDVLPHIHIWLVFILHIKSSEPAIRLLENDFPWEALVSLLNSLTSEPETDKFETENFPIPEQGIGRPLPEDYTLRGLDWAKTYFPEGWFEDAQVDDEERLMELPSMESVRVERILWIATRIAASGDHLIYSNGSFSAHQSLLKRINESKNYAKFAPYTPSYLSSDGLPEQSEHDSDVDMTAADEDNESDDDDYVLVGQSEEFRRLKEQQRQLKAQLKSSWTPDVAPEVKHSLVKGPEALRPQYTVLVVDTNLLLSHPETFKFIVSSGNWAIIIPNCVITELVGLAKNSGTVQKAASSAILLINEYLSEKKDIKVITSKGNNVTYTGFYKEQLGGAEDIRNIDDIIIQTTKQQGEIRRQTLKEAGDAEPAVLITEDRNMRVKANARGVTAIAASALMRILSPEWSKEKDLSSAKRKSFGTPVKQRFPDWQEDDDDLFTPSDLKGELDNSVSHIEPNTGVNKKRQYKRGKMGMMG